MTVRWGILSTALINERILAAAQESDRVEVVAVASRDRGRATRYAAERGIPRSYGTYDALLADAAVDAVYIPLPNSMHAEWTIRSLQAGKHVLVEKPFARDPATVAEAFDLAERRGLVLSEAFMWRHHPQTDIARGLVADGAIGRLRVVRVSFSFSLEAARGAQDTRFDPALAGGSLMDVGCYCLSALRLFAGEPERVSAERADGPSGVDVAMSAALAFPNDVLGHFDCGFVMPYRAELECVGETGTLHIQDPWLTGRTGITLRREASPGAGTVDEIDVPAANSYRLELEDVAEAITTGRPPRLGREDAMGQVRAIAALYRSAETGQAVSPARK